MRYLTGRFAPHTPRWQLVIWARQLTVLVVVALSQIAFSEATNPAPPGVELGLDERRGERRGRSAHGRTRGDFGQA